MSLTIRQRAAVGAAAGLGMAAGLGLFTFGYARGASYLTNDPAACANCHVMAEHFAAWQRGSHRVAATCNDCHTPHNLVGKYTTKALNGFWHSFYFTTGNYPDPLRITERNREITEESCRYCHAQIVDAIDPAVASADAGRPTGVPRTSATRTSATRTSATRTSVAQAGVVPAPLSAAAVAALTSLAAAQGGAGDRRPAGRSGSHADAELSCVRCHTYVGHWVR